jgi:predicted TIM-barrel fold metal-dependent hydrolase
MLDAVPDLTVIAAHMGGYGQWDAVEQYLVGRQVYFDTAYSLCDLGVERMTEIIRRHGAHRILFGTDYPWKSAKGEIEAIRSLSLPARDIDKILSDNALALLNSR